MEARLLGTAPGWLEPEQAAASRMRAKTAAGAARLMQLTDSSAGAGSPGRAAAWQHARATACTVSVLPAAPHPTPL